MPDRAGSLSTGRGAFTLIEVVLAIALTSVVLVIVATAIHLFLFRVDASRTEVETAQLARTLLQQIADDLRAVRFAMPVAKTTTSMGSAAESSIATESSLTTEAGVPDASQATQSESVSSPSDDIVLGIFGTETTLRIDRSAAWHWQRLANADGTRIDEADYAQTISPPQTVRYFVREGKQFNSETLVAAGLEEQPADNIAGLCREQLATAAAHMLDENGLSDSTASDLLGTRAELLAPEVVDLQFAYFDGSALDDQWDTAEQENLPRAVEIRLTLLKQPYALAHGRATDKQPSRRPDGSWRYSENDVVEYRQVVELPKIHPPRQIPASQSPNSPRNSSKTNSDTTNGDTSTPQA